MKRFLGILDQYDDGGAFLRESLVTYGAGTVPKALRGGVDMAKVGSGVDGDYAVTIHTDGGKLRRYPVVDRANTAMSAMYFAEYGHQLPADVQKTAAVVLRDRLSVHGLAVPQVVESCAEGQSMSKTAGAVDSAFRGFQDMVDIAEESASLEGLFGIGSNSEVSIVQDHFDGFTPTGRRRLMFQVKEAGVSMDQFPGDMLEYLRDEVGPGIGAAVSMRRRLVVDEEGAQAALDSFMAKTASASAEELISELQQFDQDHNLCHRYYRVIPDPVQSVCGGPLEKTASSAVDIGGSSYTDDGIVSWLDSGGKAQLAEAFSDEMAEQMGKAPTTVLASLPTTHQRAIARMMNG